MRSGKPGLSLAVLGTATFVYVMSENFPVALLPQMAEGLNVSKSSIGLLVTIYAVVVGATAIPLTLLATRWTRRRTAIITVAALAVSNVLVALAPNYPTLAVSRLLAACAHGVFWSIIAPLAASLAGPVRAGRATAIVFAGSSLSFVLGLPIASALGSWFGWRVAGVLLAVVSALCMAALVTLLPHAEERKSDAAVGTTALRTVARNGGMRLLCGLVMIMVVGHFAAYTFITLLIEYYAHLQDAAVSLLLLASGVMGLIGVVGAGRVIDHSPRRVALFGAGGTAVSLLPLSLLHGHLAPVAVVLLLVWAIAFAVMPVSFQSAVLRVVPQSADVASSLLVVAFQVGIAGGALLGGGLVDLDLESTLPVVAGVSAALGVGIILVSRTAFPAVVKVVARVDEPLEAAPAKRPCPEPPYEAAAS